MVAVGEPSSARAAPARTLDAAAASSQERRPLDGFAQPRSEDIAAHRGVRVEPPAGIPQHDLYEAIGLQIERENTLVNYRLNWTLQLNGFLFTTIGLLSGKTLGDRLLMEIVRVFVPVTGLVVSLACLFGVLAAQGQLAYLCRHWEAHVPAFDPRPRPFGDRRGFYVLGMAPCLLPPGILALVWGCLLLLRIWPGA